MKKYIDFNKNWLFSAKETDGEKPFADSDITLPFFHAASSMPECTFTCVWTPSEEFDGKTVYLEIGSLWANAEIFVNGKAVAEHIPAACVQRYPLLLEARLGEKYEITVEAVPQARPDGMFAFTGVRLIALDSSHFDMTRRGDGVYVTVEKDKTSVKISISADIVRPINYDVVSYTVTYMNGETVFSQTCKPTSPETSFTLDNAELWDGQSGAGLYTLHASLLRDSACLDEVFIDFGIKDTRLGADGFLQLNGLNLPLSGVRLTDCTAVKSDISHLEILDCNTLITSVLPTKTDLPTHCDKRGIMLWYISYFTGNVQKDMLSLEKFLHANASHASLCAVVCPQEADERYFNAFYDTVKQHTPHIFTAIERDLENAIDNIPEKAEIIYLNVPYNAQPDAFVTINGRFSALQEKYPDKYFAVCAKAPSKNEVSDEAFEQWHIRLWSDFYRQKGVIAYFGGILSDTRGENGERGLTSYDRTRLYDVFRYYESRFSSKGFIKICDTVTNGTDSKSADVKCITNCDNLRILVNGKDRKYVASKLTDGIYVFKGLKLKKGINTVEVSAGDECDYAEIER